MDIRQHFDAVDESARRQHAQIQAVAGDWLANVDRVLQQVAALGVYRNAELSRLQEIAGPGVSSINSQAVQYENQTNAPSSGGTSPTRPDEPGTTPSVPGGEVAPAPGPSSNVRSAWGYVVAAAVAGAIAALSAWWLMDRDPAPTNPTAQQAGSMYQYLEDQDAHLPQP